MIEDSELLRRYAEEKSEAAFAELVQRRIGLVFSVALRHTGGDAHRAQDVTQAVFTALARKAPTLCRRPVLAGWLYRSAQFAAIDAVRAERRRQKHADEAQFMEQIAHTASEPDWEKLRPALDDALNAMDERDRDAVALRFFEGRPFAQIGERLRLSENAARMRVDRALERLRDRLSQRGVTSTTAALATLLATEAAAVAPAGLAASITTAATVSGGSLAALATFMTLTKVQVGLTSAALVAGATGFTLQANNHARLRAEIASVSQQSTEIDELRLENGRLQKLADEVADLRRDDAKLTQLRDEAEVLKGQLEAATRAQAARDRAAALKLQAAAAEAAKVAVGLNIDRLDRQPRVRSQAKPVYPPELRSAGISGEVMVSFIVDSTGQVRQPVAVQSTQREFEAPAIEAASKWIFEAGLKGGRSVNTRMQVPIVFSAGNGEAAASARESGDRTRGTEPAPRPGEQPARNQPEAVRLAPVEVTADPNSSFPPGSGARPRWF